IAEHLQNINIKKKNDHTQQKTNSMINNSKLTRTEKKKTEIQKQYKIIKFIINNSRFDNS
ncbi:hypothetical protein Q6261_26285, partial [Klebsiella pneumoniae]|uniref:hypothetical protein n=1 Tax=Klebsiella pneumoniae TaxID=573 RepID=UPI0027305C82